MESIERRLKLPAANLAVLFGVNDANIRIIEQRIAVTIVARGENILLRGDETSVETAEKILKELVFVVNKTDLVDAGTLAEVEARLRSEIRPGTGIVRASNGHVDIGALPFGIVIGAGVLRSPDSERHEPTELMGEEFEAR